MSDHPHVESNIPVLKQVTHYMPSSYLYLTLWRRRQDRGGQRWSSGRTEESGNSERQIYI